MDNNGRPEYTDEQYANWLEDMAPFLRIGYSLFSAMDKAWLLRHKDSIYRKYRLKDWFCEKIDAYQRYPGEIVNSIFARLIMAADEKVKHGEPLTHEEWRNLRFFAEKHRSCQPFFVTRQEVAQVEPDKVSNILVFYILGTVLEFSILILSKQNNLRQVNFLLFYRTQNKMFLKVN